MKNPVSIVFLATKQVLAEKRYRVWFIALSVFFLIAYVFVPVWLTPGNSIGFQLGLLKPRDYALFIVLAPAASLLALMHAFLFFRSRTGRTSVAAQSGVGVFSAFFGGLLATAACSSCVIALLGFLGAGSMLFILKHQSFVVAGALALVCISLYLSARRVVGLCDACEALK